MLTLDRAHGKALDLQHKLEVGGPTYQEFDFRDDPMPNPTGKVRVVGRGSWDPYGYRWVSECRFLVYV